MEHKILKEDNNSSFSNLFLNSPDIYDSTTHKATEFILLNDRQQKPFVKLIDELDKEVEQRVQQKLCAGGIYKIIPSCDWVSSSFQDEAFEKLPLHNGQIEFYDRMECGVKHQQQFCSYFLKKWHTEHNGFVDQFLIRSAQIDILNNCSVHDAISAFENFATRKHATTHCVPKYLSNLMFTSTRNSNGKNISKPQNLGKNLDITDGQYDALRRVFNPYNTKQASSNISSITSNFAGPYSSFCLNGGNGSLASWNYLHFGGSKIWIGIHQSDSMKVLRYLRPLIGKQCDNPLQHEQTFVTLKFLEEMGVNYDLLVQRPGEFVITRAKSLYQGINVAFNISSEGSFVSQEWADFARMPLKDLLPICWCFDAPLNLSNDEIFQLRKAHKDVMAERVNLSSADKMRQYRLFQESFSKKQRRKIKDAAAKKTKRLLQKK